MLTRHIWRYDWLKVFTVSAVGAAADKSRSSSRIFSNIYMRKYLKLLVLSIHPRLCKLDMDNSQHAFEILMNHRWRCWKANKFHALQMIKRGWKTEEMNFLALPTNSPVIKRFRKIFCNPAISLSYCFAFSKLNSWIFIQIYPFLGEVFRENLNNVQNIKMPQVSMLFALFTRSLTK